MADRTLSEVAARGDGCANAHAVPISLRPRRRPTLALAVLCALLLAGTVTQQPAGASATNATFSRLAGVSRYETAVEIAREYLSVRVDTGSKPDTAILTSGADEHFGYALTAPPLSSLHGAPLLLTPPGELPASVASFLGTNDLEHVIIIGDTDVVASDVAAQVRALGLSVTRIGGDDVYSTAVAVAARVGSSEGVPGSYRNLGRTSLVATGEIFADALAAGPLAYRGRHPMLLTSSLDLDPEVKQFLVDSGTDHVVILGGPAAVSPWVEYDILDLGISVGRLYGPDRFATAARIAEQLLGSHSAGGCFDGSGFGIAYGRRAADALAAGPLLGEMCSPLLLTERNSLPRVVAVLLESDDLAPGDNAGNLHLTAFGGSQAVTSFTVLQSVASATLAKIGANIAGVKGRCYLEVNFDEPVLTSDAANPANYRRAGVSQDAEGATVEAGADDTTMSAVIVLDRAARNPASAEPVGCENPLAAKEEIEIRGGLIGDHSGRRVVRRTVAAVVPDARLPQLTLAAHDAASAVLVTASEAVRLSSGIAEVRRDGPEPETVTISLQVTEGATSFEVPVPASLGGKLRAGDSITIEAGAIEDLAGNLSNRARTTAFGDNTPPEVAKVTVSRPRGRAGASIAVDALRDGQSVRAALTVTAKSFGAAAGAIGNSWMLEIVQQPEWLESRIAAVSISDGGNAGRIHVLVSERRLLEDVVADLNRDLSFRASFTAELDDRIASTPGNPVTLGGNLTSTRLRGGLSSTDLTVAWSEPVVDCAASDGAIAIDRLKVDVDDDGTFDYSLDGGDADAAGVTFVAAPGGNPAIVVGGATCDTAAGVRSGTLVARIESDDESLLPGLSAALLVGDESAVDLNGNNSLEHRFDEFTRPSR